MLRRGVHPYIFVLNNDGYEIERLIHGETAKYNDIQMYDHQLMLPFLAGKACKVRRLPPKPSELCVDICRPHTSQSRFTLRKSCLICSTTRHSMFLTS